MGPADQGRRRSRWATTCAGLCLAAFTGLLVIAFVRSTEPGMILGSGDGAPELPAPTASRPTIEQRGGLLTAVFSDRTDDGALAAAVPDLIAKGVVSVALRAAPIKDLRPLGRMTQLTSLDICGTQVRDLSPL